MTRKQGYYSLVQFCPDPARAEVVNLGVLLFSPEHQFLEVSMSKTVRRVKSVFPQIEYDTDQIKTIISWLKKRLEVERARIRDKNDLNYFFQTRINDIRITEPRSIMVGAPIAKLRELYSELVEIPKASTANREAPETLGFPELDAFFQRPDIAGHVEENVTFDVPISGRTIEVPYVFTNGTINLVKPERIGSFEAAEKWLVDGLLITSRLGTRDKQRELHLLVDSPKERVKEQVGQLNAEITGEHVKFYLEPDALIDVLGRKAPLH